MAEASDRTRYLYEKFHTGLTSLAEGPGRIKERLEDAYVSQIMRGDGPPEDLPKELRDQIDRFHERMTAVKDETGTIGHIRATVEAMTEDEACDMAREVTQIEYGLREAGADKWD